MAGPGGRPAVCVGGLRRTDRHRCPRGKRRGLGRPCRGLRLRDGSLVEDSDVIVATGPRDAAKLGDETNYPMLRGVVDGLISLPVACLDVALERLPVPKRPVSGAAYRSPTVCQRPKRRAVGAGGPDRAEGGGRRFRTLASPGRSRCDPL